MDYSQYETYETLDRSAFNLSTGSEERSYQEHWHTYGEIVLVGPGEKNLFQVGQTQYELVEGDFVLIWPMEMHAILDADRKDSLVIQFSNSFINSMFDLQRIVHYYHNLHVLCIYAHPELVKELNGIAQEMKETFFSAKMDRELRCCMLLMKFMLKLDEYREEFAKDFGVGERSQYSGEIMHRMIYVTDYIKNNLTADDLSQAAMAEMAGISKDYFSRIFKNVTGLGYSKWLNMIRLEKAVSLLSTEGMSLTEVAMLSGFQSIPSFNRIFRNEKGMAPGEFREQYAMRQQKSKG